MKRQANRSDIPIAHGSPLLSESVQITGRVFLSDGRPATDAKVVVASTGHIQLEDGWPTNEDDHFSARSDEQGRFRLSARRQPNAPLTIYIVDETGAAIVTGDQLDHPSIEISPWQTVRGISMRNGEPTPDTQLLMRGGHYPWADFDPDATAPALAPLIRLSMETRSDSKGQFFFDRVPPRMEGDVHRVLEDDSWGFCAQFSSPKEKPGPIEPDWMCIDGCTVVGQFEFPEMKEPITAATVQWIRKGFEPPPGYQSLPPSEQFEIYQSWCNSPEGQRANGRCGYAMLRLDDRGQFQAVDVPPGVPLKIEASFYDNVARRPFDDLIRRLRKKPREVTVSREITLTKQSEPINVGVIS